MPQPFIPSVPPSSPLSAGRTVWERMLPPIQVAGFYFLEEEILSGALSVVLIPAQAGLFHVPVGAVVYREPGAAYSGSYTFTVGATTMLPALALVLTTAGPGIAIYYAPGAAASSPFSLHTGLAANINTPLLLAGTLSGGTGGMYLTLAWQSWPFRPVGL